MLEGLKPLHWHPELDSDNILHLTLDRQGEAVNSLGQEVIRELKQITERLAADPPRGVIFYSGKSTGFIAGADIREFESFAGSGRVYSVLRNGQKAFDAVEALPCPTVAAIDGFCMGGGLELALACRFRVASTRRATRLGLPEVNLGIHPGWGGTVRLPRLIGAPTALDMILSGRALSAKAARSAGLVDRIADAEQLRSVASKLILGKARPTGPGLVPRLSNLWPARQVLAKIVGNKIRSRANPKHYPAPFAALNLWRRYAGNPEKGMVAEARSVAKLGETPTARSLVRVFFLREQMKALGDSSSAKINRVHVVGAGVMGGDIAAWCAYKGLTVTLQDREEKYVTPALDRARKLFEKKLKSPAKVAETMERLTGDVEGNGVEDADIVIEAIYENLEAKQSLLKGIEPRLQKNAIIATNTSSIPLEEIAKSLDNPRRLVGLHFFNPVAKMPLVEIVRHAKLNKSVFTRVAGLCQIIDRLPVAVASSPGFLVNRILMPYVLEAVTLLGEGVPGRVIDKQAVAFGMPMGPIELADQVGLDVCASVGEILAERLGITLPDSMNHMLESGKRGKKDGEGFYRYEDGKPQKPEAPDGYSAPADLEDRLILPLLNQAVACLREGVVDTPEMLDAGVIFGTGFAPFRSGPYQHIVDTGPADLKKRLENLAERHGDRFTPDAGWDDLIADSTAEAA